MVNYLKNTIVIQYSTVILKVNFNFKLKLLLLAYFV